MMIEKRKEALKPLGPDDDDMDKWFELHILTYGLLSTITAYVCG